MNKPDSWQGTDANEGYHFGRDNGFYFGPESINSFTGNTLQPGEIWEYRVRLTVSTEPTDNQILLEVFDVDGDYLFQKPIPSFGGTYREMKFTVPAYEVNGGFSAPASSSADIEIGLQVAGSDSGNYWLQTEAVRLRRPVDNGNRFNGGTGGPSMDSGQL